MYEMTVRTPGLTWVRVAPNVAEMLAILRAAHLPGCDVKVRDMHGTPVVLHHAADAAAATAVVELSRAA